MARFGWQELPRPVQAAIEARTGLVAEARPVVAGAQADLATVLVTASGTYFCKGVYGEGAARRGLRNEVRLNAWLPELAPRLRWSLEESGWLVVGFECATGRHPDLTPGSPDLPVVAATLAVLTEALTPCPPVRVQAAAARWAEWINPQLVDGDTLLHTDVTPNNFLVGDQTYVVDWSMPCRGAAWIDTARMVIRLIGAGHSPAAGEAWAQTVPAWTTASSRALDAFAAANAGLSRLRHRQTGAAHLDQLATAAEKWTRSRSAVCRAVAPEAKTGR